MLFCDGLKLEYKENIYKKVSVSWNSECIILNGSPQI